MTTLVLDRSSAQPSFALFEGANMLFTHTWQGEPTRAPDWMAHMRTLLLAQGVAIDAIGSFVCGLGPGSFSGIRACLAAVNGMALPTKTPVYGVASAAALASAQPDDMVTVVGDARRNRLWCVTYCKAKPDAALTLLPGERPTQSADDFQLVEAERLASIIPENSRIISTDWLRLEALLTSCFAPSRLLASPVHVSAEAIGRLALADPAARKLEPSPIYLHPAV